MCNSPGALSAGDPEQVGNYIVVPPQSQLVAAARTLLDSAVVSRTTLFPRQMPFQLVDSYDFREPIDSTVFKFINC